jgi:hypothetical protein
VFFSTFPMFLSRACLGLIGCYYKMTSQKPCVRTEVVASRHPNGGHPAVCGQRLRLRVTHRWRNATRLQLHEDERDVGAVRFAPVWRNIESENIAQSA